MPCLWIVLAQAFAGDVIHLDVDASAAPRRVIHANLAIPVKPGPLTLLYPKWLPGEHAPDGPIGSLGDVQFRANDAVVPWTRDTLDAWTFHLVVPDGATVLDVSLDDLLSTDPDKASTTSTIAVVDWNELLLIPDGVDPHVAQITASLKLPDGWIAASALDLIATARNESRYAPTTIEALIDSPVLAGRYAQTFPLAPDVAPVHHLDVVAEDPARAVVKPEFVDDYSRLVREAVALFGTTHYRHYDFLVALSDSLPYWGLEHHESSDNRVAESTFTDDVAFRLNGDLLPHEFVHSWCGKFRRPAGLATGDYTHPMQTDLLWAYEGLTQYWGYVLAARSGIWSTDDLHDRIATDVGELQSTAGRTWRPLQDTATDAATLYDAPHAWSYARRSVDFYFEGALMWMEADARIRDMTHGKRSLDDFAQAFFGGASTGPEVHPYTLDDLASALNAIAPYDWKGFFRDRLDQTTRDLSPALAAAGWTIAYDDKEPPLMAAEETANHHARREFSVGLVLTDAGVVDDVTTDGPAAAGGLAPGMHVVAIDDRAYTPDVLDAAIVAAQKSTEPIRFLVENAGWFTTLSVDWHGGARWPHLVRSDPKSTDWLAAIATPRIPVPKPTASQRKR